MFTGIIQEIGKVIEGTSIGGNLRFVIEAPRLSPELNVSDSVSVNGVCQTVIDMTGGRFSVVAVEETLRKTTLGKVRPHAPVNLELPLRLGDRLGGHLVLGHVDCVGKVGSILQKEGSWLFRIRIPESFQRYVIPVGSIAVDGVSLTVASVDGDIVAVSIIPHTFDNTIFSGYATGTEVNLEFDMIGKYIEGLLGLRKGQGDAPAISAEQLRNWGYDVG